MTDKIHIPITSPRGVLLKTGGKFCDRDIEATPELEELTVTENGEYIPPKVGYSKVIVDVASNGEAVTDKYYVNFYDYEGTLLYSYSKDEVEALTELPPLPEHEGLICQGWNWSLDDIKAEGKETNVGAMYITDDGKTRLYIHIAAEGRMDVPVYFKQSIANSVTVDWGDGSATETYSSTKVQAVHTYASIGDYVITLDVADGRSLTLGHGTSNYCVMGTSSDYYRDSGVVYCNMLKKVEIGKGVFDIHINTFHSCYSLESITIPNSVKTILENAFYYCYSLASVTIPNGVTSIGKNAFSNCHSFTHTTIPHSVTSIGESAFGVCYALASVTIPNSVTTINRTAFTVCYALASVTIPNSVTSIKDRVFNECRSLTSITIPDSITSIGEGLFYSCNSLASVIIPDSVTSIGENVFSGCYSLVNVTIPNGVTSIGKYTFNGCSSLTSITIPDSVTSIGQSAFARCYSLASVIIPNSVTSIGSAAFEYCYSLANITIPSGVTSMGTSAFQYCYSLANINIPAGIMSILAGTFRECAGIKFYDFSEHIAVPTLSETSAFASAASDFEIRVPAALYDEWIAATNWSTYAAYTVTV